ncbi:PQQ-binding-like beta-propeller repeat protein [Frankia sp. AgB1.9]|uniref:outer membrane protein assembly factor BamB family protein n=1 Tax=unclassified Frankia TaxID=2632575 RepID=UPI0019327AC4|nr:MULTISPECIES: PQQ-binding-like beta-propeller repeat protein [unclassified Frankia]MBL7488860.1 PQQ-binding-like beta-propeller repeat protein [Frankia sp. AgW1.1]MBL7547596.1 PQQ-binding-like beta-propeller repeat protein [Frankia sp. AgB1.9]MBL7619517.1 PQQ-binding-like beta-propeller repeat protein [Frankia sp. AgB1.8]
MTGWSLAVDFGTSFTCAAWQVGGGAAEVLEIDNSRYLPSAVWLDPDGQLTTGKTAVSQGGAFPERLERLPKRALVTAEAILLGEETVGTVDVVAAVLRRVAAEARRRSDGTPPSRAVLTHPARWTAADLDKLRLAAEKAGLPTPVFVSEPVAAASWYAASEDIPDGAHLAVYDLGGGTLDTAVLRRVGGGFTVVGRPGGDGHFGGEDVDEAMLEVVGGHAADLDQASWERIWSDTSRAGNRTRALTRQDLVLAKESLSRSATHTLYLMGFDDGIRVTRRELEDAVGDRLDASIDELVATIASAGLAPDQLFAICLTGNATRMPRISELVSARTGQLPRATGDPKTVTALGALIAAGTTGAPPLVSRPPVGVPPVGRPPVPPPLVSRPPVGQPPLTARAGDGSRVPGPTAPVQVALFRGGLRRTGAHAWADPVPPGWPTPVAVPPAAGGPAPGTPPPGTGWGGLPPAAPAGPQRFAAPVGTGPTVVSQPGIWKTKISRLGAGSPAVGAGPGGRPTLFVTGLAGRLHAVDLATGHQVWALGLGNGGSSPVVADGVVYCGGRPNQLFALDAATGQPRWAFHGASGVDAAPALSGGVLFAGGWDGRVYALDAETGAVRWIQPAGGWVAAAPAVVGDTLYVGCGSGRLYAVGAGEGELRWQYDAGGAIWSAPAVLTGSTGEADLVVVGSHAHVLHGIDAATGQARWRRPLSGGVYTAPAVDPEGIAYLTSQGGMLTAVDTRDGSVRWTRHVGGDHANAALTPGLVVITGARGRLHGLDAATGTSRWTAKLGSLSDASPIVITGLPGLGASTLVAVGTSAGTLLTLDAETGNR